ncbi:hypothetical protein HMPREF0673_01868 [Leyella stercorea DSM 18206]|uniref:Uncharacterized protein n=1 Tax=Leyella stercorea DSM 18206 TaxID=1002367 RepID=G6AZ06_9BACT|nr:hypothetical protein HMPREF0673_01868 [Leyella stercorea DSM 18206]
MHQQNKNIQFGWCSGYRCTNKIKIVSSVGALETSAPPDF